MNNTKPMLIIYDKETNTESTRTYESHTECFSDFANLRSLGIDVKVVVS